MTAAASPARSIVRLAEVDSTQRIAFALAADGAADGTVVVADYQSAGRGRRGRTWAAPPGTSLLASIIVRSHLDPARWPLYSFAAALAVADALEALGVAGVRLSWPNDVLVRGRKIAGILIEARADAGVLVVGIGINLRQREFPAWLRVPATSVRLETGREVDRDRVLDTLRDAFAEWRDGLERHRFATLRARWIERSATLGTRVRVDDVEGLAVDVADDGALVVDDGTQRHHVIAGELSPVRREV